MTKSHYRYLQGSKKLTTILLSRKTHYAYVSAFANQFQKWVYQFYPSHSELGQRDGNIIENLGGSTLVPPGERF